MYVLKSLPDFAILATIRGVISDPVVHEPLARLVPDPPTEDSAPVVAYKETVT